MTSYPQLTRPPIAEALLDLRVEFGAEVSLAKVISFGEAIRDSFPVVQTLESHTLKVRLGDDASVQQHSPAEIGKIHWNTANSRAVQVMLKDQSGGPGGFTINWTHGYQNFESLMEMTRPLWSLFCEHLSPARVIRCALRYINHLDIPDNTNLATLLRTGPYVGANIASTLDEFFMRVVMDFGEDRKGVITESLSSPGDSQNGLLLFDIDVFSQKAINVEDRLLWEEFNVLRSLKNRCFFESFTHEALEGFR